MENNQIFSYKDDKIQLENNEIDRIMQAHKNLEKNQIQQNLSIELDKSSEWLNFFFTNPEVKELYTQNERVKSLLIIQCLYYLTLFNNLYATESTDFEMNQLPLLNLKSSKINQMNFQNHQNLESSQNIILDNSRIKNKKDKNLDKLQNYFKVGIIGIGSIGTFLLKHLIAIKDNNIMKFKIIASTRRPNQVDFEILNSIDDQIEIILDNEKVFNECNLIFLCVQPHQLDLILKEISQSFKERIEKMRKKKNLIYPTIISLLSAVNIDRLRILFPDEVNIQRTFLDPIFLKKLSDNNYYQNTFGSQTNLVKNKSRLLTGNTFNMNLDNKTETSIMFNDIINDSNSKSFTIRKGGIIINTDIVKFTEESFSHLFINFRNDFVEFLLNSFHQSFNFIKKKKDDEIYPNDLLKSVMGENALDLFKNHFENKKIFKNSVDEINDECKINFMKIIRNLFKSLEN